jgi:hypothetical protein
MADSFLLHELIEIEAGKEIRYFRMSRPDSGCYSTELLFVHGQIIISGDIRIGPTGSVIARGYGLDWFADRLDGDYLCEKFLTTRRPNSGQRRQQWDADAGWLSIVQRRFRELYLKVPYEAEMAS